MWAFSTSMSKTSPRESDLTPCGSSFLLNPRYKKIHNFTKICSPTPQRSALTINQMWAHANCLRKHMKCKHDNFPVININLKRTQSFYWRSISKQFMRKIFFLCGLKQFEMQHGVLCIQCGYGTEVWIPLKKHRGTSHDGMSVIRFLIQKDGTSFSPATYAATRRIQGMCGGSITAGNMEEDLHTVS